MNNATQNRIDTLRINNPGITKKEEMWLDCNFRNSWVLGSGRVYKDMREAFSQQTRDIIVGLDRDILVLKGMRLSLKYVNESRVILFSLVQYFGEKEPEYKKDAKTAAKNSRALRAEIQELEARLLGEAKEAVKAAARIHRALRAK